MIIFADLTIPTPAAYNAEYPHQQQENFYYVLNQILTQLKTNEETLDIALVEALQALQYNGAVIDLGDVSIVLTGKTTLIDNT